MRFEDFVLQFDSSPRGGFRARVLKSPFGEGVVGFTLPSPPRGASADPVTLDVAGITRGRELDHQGVALPLLSRSPREIGTELFRSIFQGQVRTLLDKSRGRLETSPNLGLRLKIKLDPNDNETGALADLPWELLFDSDTEDFIALSYQTSLVRYLDVPRSSQPIPFTPTLRILVVSASPHGMQPLDLDEEMCRLEELNRSFSGIKVRFLPHASASVLREALAGDTYNVLHFMGHGTFDPASGEGMLLFEGPDGSPDSLSGRSFAGIFKDLRSLGVVVLNACNTARARNLAGSNPFRGVATALVLGGVPAVVAMQRPISDRAAIGFSTAFYRQLAYGDSIDEALTQGRHAILAVQPEAFEWATPVLFLRIPDGNVFAGKPARRPREMELPAPTGPISIRPKSGIVNKIVAGMAYALLVALVLYTRALSPSTGSPHPGANASSDFHKLLVNHGGPMSAVGHGTNPKESGDIGPERDRDTDSTFKSVESRPVANDVESRESDAIPQDSAAHQTLASASTPAPPPTSIASQHAGAAETPTSAAGLSSFPVQMSSFVPREKEELSLPVSFKNSGDQSMLVSCLQRRAWIAYFQSSEGKLAPIRDTLNTDNDEDWIGLHFTDYGGPRIRVGVLKVINKSDDPEQNRRAEKIESPVSWIEEMLTGALYNTKRFHVIDPKVIQTIEARQIRNDVLEPSPTSIMNIGRVFGAQYLIYGTVNEWNPERASRSMVPGGIFNAGKKEAEVAITFFLVDVVSGQILFTTSERARLGERSFGWRAPDGGGATTQNTLVSYAVRACVNKAALKIATFLRDRKWRGLVLDVKRSRASINAGSLEGIVPGLLLSVFTANGVVKNVEGRMLGEDLKEIGTLSVDSVQPGFSIAHVVNGCKGIREGDRVELATDPVPPPSIPQCDKLTLN